MKKIAEMVMGGQQVDYKLNGAPTAFVSYDTESKEFKGLCFYCQSIAYFNRWYQYGEEYTCPVCGAKHKGNEIDFNHDTEQVMPYALKMNLIDFKDKIELRIVYDGISLNREHRYGGKLIRNIREKYVFDFKHHRAYWQCDSVKEDIHSEQELGDIDSFDAMKEKTALWYIAADHYIRKGSQTDFLKTLRNAVNRHMKELGFQPKSLFLPSHHAIKLFASVLTIAQKVRFWDAEALPYGGKGTLSYHEWLTDIVKIEALPKDWKKNRDEYMKKGMNYNDALIASLGLPNTPFVRKHLAYKNLYALCKAFSLPTKDMACMAFPVFKELSKRRKGQYGGYEDDCRTIHDIIEFITTFYPFCHDMKVNRILHQWSEWDSDILRLWHSADQITRQKYAENPVPLSKIHDWLSVAIAEQQDREVIFPIDGAIIKALHQCIDGYQFHCVEKRSELKKIAMTLRNCSLSYANSIGRVEQLVVVTDDDGSIIALLEIREGKIKQAKLFANKQVATSEEVNKACVEYSKMTKLLCNTEDINMSAA